MTQPTLNADGLPADYPFQKDWEITPRQTKQWLDEAKDFLLLDVRMPAEHAICNLDQATLIPMQVLPQRIDELQDAKDKPIVVFCHHGGRSMQVARFLKNQGFDDVVSMAGGIDLWAIDLEPGMPRY